MFTEKTILQYNLLSNNKLQSWIFVATSAFIYFRVHFNVHAYSKWKTKLIEADESMTNFDIHLIDGNE